MILSIGFFATVKEFVLKRVSVRIRKKIRQIIIYATWCMILNNGANKMYSELFLKLVMYKYINNSCKVFI